MGLLQRALETYEANQKLVGVYRAGHDPLVPVGHVLTKAQIEITLNPKGEFFSATSIDASEPKIIIPVTEESSGRSSGLAPHPLCDQLKYVAPDNKEANKLYLKALQEWIQSIFSHPFLRSIYNYVKNGSIISDLSKAGVIKISEKNTYDEKVMICWRVIGIQNEDPACWKNQNLFKAFFDYYCDKLKVRPNEVCMLSGKDRAPAIQHPKGIISINGNAKLISANDSIGFTYRGRFSEPQKAVSVGYEESQKAHNALRWLATEQGVREFSGNRIFLCWNPQGKEVLSVLRRIRKTDAEPLREPSNYRDELKSTLWSLRQDKQLKATENVVITALDAATTGRLAVTYYNEFSMGVFLNRMEDWDAHCCWYMGKFGIQAPDLFDIVNNAFGTQRGNFLETDDKIQRQHLQRLLNCKVEGGVFPYDIVKALTQRASAPLAYEEKVWRKILSITCAVLQKYRYDTKQGGDEMAWELDKKDRSFQYGRLLAVMERAEEDYYNRSQESRQTNAIKFMSEFRQRPFYVFERINRQLQQAYLPRLESWQKTRYEKLTGEIIDIIKEFPEPEINRPLDDLYLMGYELQRNTFFVKKDDVNDHVTEEEE